MNLPAGWRFGGSLIGLCGLLGCSDPIVQSIPAAEVVPTRTYVPEGGVSTFPVGTVVSTYGEAVLADLESGNTTVGILRLAGTPRDMGYQYGRLAGDRIIQTWTSLMSTLGADMGNLTADQAEQLLGPSLQKAYQHLAPYFPPDIQDEIEGIFNGARDAGVSYLGPDGADLSTVLRWIITLTNLTDVSSLDSSSTVARLLLQGNSSALNSYYMGSGSTQSLSAADVPAPGGEGTTFFAAWGKRASEGKLFAGRNLDWTAGSGLDHSALITVYVPDGGPAFATFGYAGFLGALAGINEHGIVVGEVGASSIMERLTGEPWTLKLREVLAAATNLEEAIPFVLNSREDGRNRAPTLGYNLMVGFGDPYGGGSKAEAAIFETNGAATALFRRDTTCKDQPSLVSYDRDGWISSIQDLGESSEVNKESSAREINAAGDLRTFKVSNGEYVRDADGYLVEDPYGSTLTVARSLECTLFRGEEALGYGIRTSQVDAFGPSGTDPRLALIDSPSFTERYAVSFGFLNALWTGSSYQHGGSTWVSSGAANRPVDTTRAIDLSRATAGDDNIMNVVYDATTLHAWIAYATSETWTRAADAPYTELDLKQIFDWELE